MKYKTTKTSVKNGYYHIIGISYCKAQNLLHYQNPVAYSAGVYGWSCDYYDIDNTCISTGYNYIDNMNTKYDYETLLNYDNKACKIICDNSIKWEDKRIMVNKLLNEFIKVCK